MKTKKIIISIIVVLALFAIYGYNKAKTLLAVFDKMTIEPAGISNIDLSFKRIKFNLDVLLTNPTIEDFSVSGFGIASVKSISVFYDGIFVATSLVNITDISIPAENQIVLHDIVVEVPKPLEFVADNYPIISSMIADFNNFKISKITTTAVIEVAGQTIDI
jgi:hypothetical protein